MGRLIVVGNFDAEFELLEPDRERSPRRRQLCRELGRMLSRELRAVGIEGLVLEPDRDPVVPPRFVGGPAVCWMPTPRAVSLLRSIGCVLAAVPTVDVLRTANDRRFTHTIGQGARGRAAIGFDSDFHDVASAAVAQIERRVERGPVVCKRRLGFAGRMRRSIEQGALGGADRAWIAGSFNGSVPGLVVESKVRIDLEWSTHGFLHRDGHVEERGIVGFRSDERGAYVATAAVHSISEDEVSASRAMLQRVAVELSRIGYHGSFAFDSFRYTEPDGSVGVRELSDLNARLTRTSFAPSLRAMDLEWFR